MILRWLIIAFLYFTLFRIKYIVESVLSNYILMDLFMAINNRENMNTQHLHFGGTES